MGSPRQTHKRPPGPSGFDALSVLLRARRHPLGFARSLVEEYGDVVSYRIGTYAGYLVRHPDHVRQILSDRQRKYGKNNFNYEKLKPVLGAGLITSEGEEWVHDRRELQTLFRRARIDAFGPVLSELTLEMLARWEDDLAVRKSIDVARELSLLTMRTIGEVLFDLDVADRAASIAERFDVVNRIVAYRFRNPFSLPPWIPTRRNRAFRYAVRGLDDEINSLVRRRHSRPSDNKNVVDVLKASSSKPPGLRRNTGRRIRDHAVTLILAGYETTAALLCWTWFLLAVHPAWIGQLRREAEARLGDRNVHVEDVNELPCMLAVIHEALRLYPPVWIISRKATADDRLGIYDVPAGTVVTISAYLIHRHPDFWSEPESFKPDRFLERPLEDRHPFSFLPFGAGPRRCIGGHLAVTEAVLVLCEMLRRFDPQIPHGDYRHPDPLVTLRPNVPLRATPRTY